MGGGEEGSAALNNDLCLDCHAPREATAPLAVPPRWTTHRLQSPHKTRSLVTQGFLVTCWGGTEDPSEGGDDPGRRGGGSPRQQRGRSEHGVNPAAPHTHRPSPLLCLVLFFLLSPPTSPFSIGHCFMLCSFRSVAAGYRSVTAVNFMTIEVK